MDNPTFALLDAEADALAWLEEMAALPAEPRTDVTAPPAPDAEQLRRCLESIGSERPADHFAPEENHVGLAAVSPKEGFAHWRIRPEWVEETARRRGGAWHHCRLVLRLYDVSCILFNGFNAQRIQDEPLPNLCGQRFFHLPRPGTWQLAEVGFVLRNGEFLPAARSAAVPFARDSRSPNHDRTALYVDDRGRIETVGSVWEQEAFLRELRRPKLRPRLRVAAFALAGGDGRPATFVRELAAQQSALGHEVHVFLPASDFCRGPREVDGVLYRPLAVDLNRPPTLAARAYARAVEEELGAADDFDLLHHHEWMTARAAAWLRTPRVLSLTSLEATRRNGAPASELSRAVEHAERTAARAAGCVLTPDWLRERAAAELRLDESAVHAFPMEGRLPGEWEQPLDFGQVKGEIGVGPLDRLILFVGPLEHSAGVDLLIEALPTALGRVGNLRLAFVGSGPMHGHLEQRARQLGVAHAVRVLGHREGPQVRRLLRAAEALVLPSRCRVPFDDAVVDLARKAGRPVVTTHGGPAHLVRHEENGLLTYDNPGSMVWALDRILGNPAHAERLGRNGRRHDGPAHSWADVARHYLELCAHRFPELTLTDE